MASARLSGGILSIDGVGLLADVPDPVSVVVDRSGGGVFLSATAATPASHLMFPIGRPSMRRFVACHRFQPFWIEVLGGRRACEVPVETQALIAEVSESRYAIFIPLIDGPMACTLRGSEDDQLILVADSSDPAIEASCVVGLFVALGDDPYALCESGARSVCEHLRTCRPRREKPVPDFTEKFGWCTWDAFYHGVSHEMLRLGLESFAQGGVRPRLIILDDGWQPFVKQIDTGESRLVDFAANDKFPGGLASAVHMAKREFGVEHFLVWHALQGYWGGVDRDRFSDYGVRDVARSFGPGILHYIPEINTEWWGAAAGVIDAGHVDRFLHDLHRHLREQGVDGVKVDNQSNLESLAAGQGGRVRLSQRYREALEGSIHVHFGGNLLNSMACGNDMIYNMRASVVARTSNDFFPNKPETHGRHLYTNALAAMWFGQFILPDWDMFQSGHEWGAFHAAARAISGGPVYVSDKPGQHDFALLRKLVLSDGSILRCQQPALPTRDCLFADPTKEDVLLKIFNRDRDAVIIGVFNCRYHENPSERYKIEGRVSPADVPALAGERFAVYSHRAGKLVACERNEAIPIALGEGEWELFSIAPSRDGFAPIGLADKFNSPRSIISHVGIKGHHLIHLRDGGRFCAWCERRPRQVAIGGRGVEVTWGNQELCIDVPTGGAAALEISL